MKIPKSTLLIALALYIGSAVASYASFAAFGKNDRSNNTGNNGALEDQEVVGDLLTLDPGEPKDQVCPLNGKFYTQTERTAWEQKRPLAVMIENTPDSRPQSGLSQADIIFEAVAEGGVTRFMAMLYCDVQISDTTLAPIRSARVYYIDYASGFNLPLYVHVGGANVPGKTDALGRLSEYGWVGENNLNQFSIGYPTFVRDYNRVPGKEIATEHTMVTSTELLWAVGTKRGWTNETPERIVNRKTIPAASWQSGYKGWQFEATPKAAGTAATTVSYDFWSGYNDYAVQWVLDPATGLYMRNQGGEQHVDLNNDKQIAAANVIVLQAEEEGPINEKKHMYYQTTGRGTAYVFQNGNVIKARWSKPTRESELVFTDEKGEELQLSRGLTWISVVNEVTEPVYQ